MNLWMKSKYYWEIFFGIGKSIISNFNPYLMHINSQQIVKITIAAAVQMFVNDQLFFLPGLLVRMTIDNRPVPPFQKD